MSLLLRVLMKEGSSEPLPVDLTETKDHFLIGSDSNCDLRLRGEGVAGLHARLIRTGGKILLERLAGRSSTLCDGNNVESRCELNTTTGGWFQLGDVSVLYEVHQGDSDPGYVPAIAPFPPDISDAGATAMNAGETPIPESRPPMRPDPRAPLRSGGPGTSGGLASGSFTPGNSPSSSGFGTPIPARSTSAPDMTPSPSGTGGFRAPPPSGAPAGSRAVAPGLVRKMLIRVSQHAPDLCKGRSQADLYRDVESATRDATQMGITAEDLLFSHVIKTLSGASTSGGVGGSATFSDAATLRPEALAEPRAPRRPAPESETIEPESLSSGGSSHHYSGPHSGPHSGPPTTAHFPPSRPSRGGGNDANISAQSATAKSPPAEGGSLMPAPPMADSEAPQIKGFHMHKKLGRGGGGTVWQAFDQTLHVDVAIKVINAVNPAAQEQLLNEARACIRIDHPSVVRGRAYRAHGSGGFYIMELVQLATGETLNGQDVVERMANSASAKAADTPMDSLLTAVGLRPSDADKEIRDLTQGEHTYFQLVAWWMAGVAEGLAEVHKAGIVHGDMKPTNLLLKPSGRLVISDFGLAAFAGAQLQRGHMRCGTPRYLAPERVAHWASATSIESHKIPSDLWSFGSTMYEFLTFSSAYPEEGTNEILHSIATIDVTPPRKVHFAVPAELDRICMLLLHRSPTDRYQSARDVAADLRAYLRAPGKKPAKRSGIFGR